MRVLASQPALWTAARVNGAALARDGLQGLLAQPRLARLNQLDLSYLDLRPESKAKIRRTLWSLINFLVKANLVRVVKRLRRLRLRYTRLQEDQVKPRFSGWDLEADSSDQVRAVLGAGRLTRLDLDSVPLPRLPPRLLLAAVLPGGGLGLANTGLVTQQVEAVLEGLPAAQLDWLDLAGLQLAEVSESGLATAVLTVQELDLSQTGLGAAQLTAVLQAALWSSRLDRLHLTGARLAEAVPAQLLQVRCAGLGWSGSF